MKRVRREEGRDGERWTGRKEGGGGGLRERLGESSR